MVLFSNIIAPLIAGLFFFLYFIFFSLANPSKAPSYKYFIIFLIGISIFALGRPLQLILGPHPLPLVIVNIRMIILCCMISPVFILASDLFNKVKRKNFQLIIISFSVFLGLVYVVFNTLGTKESMFLFQFAGILTHDNLTPSMNPPFYGREVTIGVQAATGLLLSAFAFIKLIRLKAETSFNDLLKNKVFLFNSGVLIFAVSFIIGSLAKQWGIYYAASIVSALLFGGSVMIDINEVYHYYEKLVPFIKEDIIQNVAFSDFSKAKLAEMLDCLGKKSSLNTFIVMKIKDNKQELVEDLKMMDEVLRITNKSLINTFDEECCLLLPLSNNRVGIALKLAPGMDAGRQNTVLEILESIQEGISESLKCSVATGIGRTHERLEDLRVSYREALNAQRYAERFENSSIVHVDDINTIDVHSNAYPVKEKEKLLSLIKVGDVDNSRRAFQEFLVKFKPFISEKPEMLRVRLYEFVGSLMDAAILSGGDEKQLNELVTTYFNDIHHIKDVDTVEKWMTGVVSRIVTIVAHVYENRSKSIIKNAMKYIEENFQSQLSYKDVAEAVYISPSYFLCLWKRETGTTFVDHLTMVRIERAKKLLLTTEKNINEIAAETGFNNSNYFSSIFKKVVGTTAKEYRGRSPSSQSV